MAASSAVQTSEPAQPFYATGKRSRDLARERGISEAALLAAHDGPEVVRLGGEIRDLIRALPDLGEVMSLTRNEAAVHEKTGAFGNISVEGQIGLVLNDAIDLRLFLQQWCAIFAVEIPGEGGPRRSLQVFDRGGDAVIKVHLKPASDVAVFERIRAHFADPKPAPLRDAPGEPKEVAPSGPIDVSGFRQAFEAMGDVHEFFPLLGRFGLSRRQALDLVDGHYARPATGAAIRTLLEHAAADALPIMCFVGNRGCIQIHHGPVATIKVMGPWLNVLDPGFNLHLRADLVAESWVVRKPTRHGLITSLELYAADQSLIAQFFGVRDERGPEDPAWRALVNGL
jgi:putative hemin transport protein